MIFNSAGYFTFANLREKDQELRGLSLTGMVREMRKHPDAILVLEGGADISTELYNQPVTYTAGTNPRRDFSELTQLIAARMAGIRVLGICRGHQLAAAAFGGTLWQDYGTETGQYHYGQHVLDMTLDARNYGFADMLNERGYPPVNSMHHQAVRDVPANALVLASYKGINEALLYPGIGLTVQWHPEFLGHTEILDYLRATITPKRADKAELQSLLEVRSRLDVALHLERSRPKRYLVDF